MSMYSDGWSPADALAVVGGRNNGDNGLFGGEGIVGLIALIIISGMFGFGGFGMGGMGGMMPWLLMSGGFNGFGGNSGAVTRADMCSEFNFNGLENAVRGVNQGLCDGFYAMNTSMLNGFHGVDNAICNLGFTTQQGFNATQVAMMQGQNAIQTQLADCCCKNQTGQMQLGNTIERGFCDTNYNAATNTNAIIQNAHNDTDRIIARIDAFERNQDREKIAQQAAEIQAYKQNAAFSAMIDASRAECPTAAYIVQPPQPVSFNTNCNGQATFGNGGCNNSYGNCCGNCY